MRMRRFSIPAVSALSVGLASGCGEKIDGEWLLESTNDGGTIQSFPVVADYGFYARTYDASMTIETDGSGELISTYTYSAYGYADSTDTYAYALNVHGRRGPRFDIAVPELPLNLSCTVASGTLDCLDDDNSGYIFVRERE